MCFSQHKITGIIFNSYNNPGGRGCHAHLPGEETEESESLLKVMHPVSDQKI